MTRLSDYQQALGSITTDFNGVYTTYNNLGLATEAAGVALDVPGYLATFLRSRADAVDLPNVIVNALGNLPYGIGFAIRQLNSVSNTVGFTVDQQAATMERLDRLWEPAQLSLEAFQDQLGLYVVPMQTLDAVLENRADELDLLVTAMGEQDIPDDTELASRMDAFAASVADWEAIKDGLLVSFEELAAGFSAAVDALEAALPNVPSLEASINSAIAIFTTAANTARDIYNALNIEIGLPGFSINLIDAINTISSFVGFIQNLIEDAVVGILNELGFNTNVFAPVEAQIISALNPVFGVLNALEDTTSGPLTAITDWLSEAADVINSVLVGLGDGVGLETLFNAELAVTDGAGGELTGTGEEEALFGNAGDDSLDGRGGPDFIFGGPGRDILMGRSGNDELFGGLFPDTIIGGLGDDFIDGGFGQDVAVFADALEDVHITDHGLWLEIRSSEGTDSVWRIEEFVFNEETFALEDVRAAADARVVFGNAEDERLEGLPGDDTILGRAGNDTLIGGAGADELNGGPGHDIASYETATRSVRVDLQNPAISFGDAAGDTFIGIEEYQTGDGIDQLRGDAGDNIFRGGGVTDRLYGRAGDDLLFGEAGADVFYGGLGADTMTGGDDAGRRDRYVYFNAAESGVGDGARDVITDFVSGEDRIELRRIDADITQGFRQAFDFIGETGFSGTAGELRYEQIGGTTLIQADRDGDGAADFEIELTGAMTLSESDFLI